jgi:hypothetical protein
MKQILKFMDLLNTVKYFDVINYFFKIKILF